MHRGAACSSPWQWTAPLSIVCPPLPPCVKPHVSTCPPQSNANIYPKHHPGRIIVHAVLHHWMWSLIQLYCDVLSEGHLDAREKTVLLRDVLTSRTDWCLVQYICTISVRFFFLSWSPHRGYWDYWLCGSCADMTESSLDSVHLGLCGCRLQWKRKYINTVK